MASWLLPAKLRPHFCNIYAYCRWSDDLADETSGGETSLQLLDWWESQLDDCYRGTATHPVFVALQSTIHEFEIPSRPFADLLVAFRQDQSRNRYETFNDLLDYCRNSANPVGRLVLHLGRCHDELRGQLSDSICTGLQLANFWQDVARDYSIGRIYLPLESCRHVGYTEAMFERHEFNPQFRRLLADEVDRAESLLRAGEPLVEQVPREFASTCDCSSMAASRFCKPFGGTTSMFRAPDRRLAAGRNSGCWPAPGCGGRDREPTRRQLRNLQPARPAVGFEFLFFVFAVAAAKAPGDVRVVCLPAAH